jgi:Uma2 family endonuclease
MASVATRLMTADEFYDWVHRPENRDRRFELEQGEVVEMSPPGERHCAVSGNTAWVLGAYVRQQKRGYVCTNDMGLLLERDPDTVRGAGVALYLVTRKFAELETKYPERLPDLAVEVLSPNDRMTRMVKRINEFLARGVSMVWLLDPESRTIAVWRPSQPQIVLEAHEELTGLDVLPDFRCTVADFFAIPGE